MDITLATFCKNHKIVLEEWELDLVSTSAFSSTLVYVKVYKNGCRFLPKRQGGLFGTPTNDS